jgi:hypothetical protein
VAALGGDARAARPVGVGAALVAARAETRPAALSYAAEQLVQDKYGRGYALTAWFSAPGTRARRQAMHRLTAARILVTLVLAACAPAATPAGAPAVATEAPASATPAPPQATATPPAATATSAPTAAPATAPAEAASAEAVLSDQQHFRVWYASDVVPLPVNDLHAWTLHVETAAGEPVDGASITVDGDMPAHGHGLPTQPRVTEALGGGDYRVEGMKFSMGGAWVITFAIEAGALRDSVTFELELE